MNFNFCVHLFRCVTWRLIVLVTEVTRKIVVLRILQLLFAKKMNLNVLRMECVFLHSGDVIWIPIACKYLYFIISNRILIKLLMSILGMALMKIAVA